MSNRQSFCIYDSSNWDSVLAAAVIYKKSSFIEFISIDEFANSKPNKQGFAISKLNSSNRVLIAGTCLSTEDMLQLKKTCPMIWLCAEAQINIEELKMIRGNRRRSSIAAIQAFDVFFPFSKYPKALLLLNYYITKPPIEREKWRKQVIPFAHALNELPKNPKSEEIQALFTGKSNVEELIERGIKIINDINQKKLF